MGRVKVKVLFFASIKDLVGISELILDVDESSTVLDVLRRLTEIYGERFREFVFSGDFNLKSHIRLALNGDYLDSSRLDEFRVHDGDVIAVLPPVSGG